MIVKYFMGWIWVALVLAGISAEAREISQSEEWLEKLQLIIQSPDSWRIKKGKLERLILDYESKMPEKDHVYAKMIHRLGDFYRQTEDFSQGIALTKKALALNQPGNPHADEAFLANSYFNLGLYYRLLNYFDISDAYLDSCLAISEKYPEKSFIGGLAYEQKAINQSILGEYQRAIEIADYGLSVLDPSLKGSQYEALLLLQKSQAELILNKLDHVEKNLLKSEQILSQPGSNPHYLGIGFVAQGQLAEEKKDYQSAKYYYTKAYNLSLSQDDYRATLLNLMYLGVLCEDTAEYEQALKYYEECFKYFEKVGDMDLEAMVYSYMGFIYQEQRQWDKALHHFQKGLSLIVLDNSDGLEKLPSVDQLKQISNQQLLERMLANLGRAHLRYFEANGGEEHLQKALTYFKSADQAIDRMRWSQNTQQSKLYWREKTKGNYEHALATCFLLQDKENAFFFMEKSRSVLLNDKLSELGAHKHLDAADIEKEQALMIEAFSLQQQRENTPLQDPNHEILTSQWFEAQTVYEKYIKTLEAKYPTYYSYKYDTTSLSIKEIKDKILDSDQTFVEFFIGENHIYAMSISPHDTQLIKIDKQDFDAQAMELLALVSDKSKLNQHYDLFSQLSHALYVQLFEPLAVNTRRVIVSIDEHLLPFELLLKNPQDPGSLLVKDFAFSYAYSAGFLAKHQKRNSKHTVLGIAPVHYKESMHQASLLGADLSLQNLLQFFPKHRMLTFEKATKSEFLKYLPDHSVVQLYSHAIADNTDSEPELYFFDETLRLSELKLLGGLTTQLIVLSACNTGIGKSIKGEGVFSLARGFAAAGIPSSITTLWQVDSKSTFQLTELFYQKLSQGMPSDLALQSAKLELMASNAPSSELPYLWAGNVLIGKTAVFIPEKTSGWMMAKLLLSIGILMVFLILAGRSKIAYK
ncbi:CHAT domain-containing protein [Pararhodonellum marinum]|uniref:CHAT domain-containing protein n=1 Tax=Pararhodonellum marinum TaxID=2755358 RepID=UPI00188F7984|nr:CHAT domain-containing protein [Pararhodonellum marinum]